MLNYEEIRDHEKQMLQLENIIRVKKQYGGDTSFYESHLKKHSDAISRLLKQHSDKIQKLEVIENGKRIRL